MLSIITLFETVLDLKINRFDQESKDAEIVTPPTSDGKTLREKRLADYRWCMYPKNDNIKK